jgi:sugar-specific transcriptional regulator TrmB
MLVNCFTEDGIEIRICVRFPIPPEFSINSRDRVVSQIKEMIKENEYYKEFVFDKNTEGFNPIPYSIDIATDSANGKTYAEVLYNRMKFKELQKYPIDLDKVSYTYGSYAHFEYNNSPKQFFKIGTLRPSTE